MNMRNIMYRIIHNNKSKQTWEIINKVIYEQDLRISPWAKN